MTTLYPGALDTTTQLKDDAVDATAMATTHKNAHNNAADALIAVETALGTNPKGTYADVAAWLADTIVKTPGSVQTITPSADVVAIRVKQGNNTYTSDLQQWLSSTSSVLAFVDKSGNFSAQTLKIAGTLLASTHLSDAGTLQKKGKVAANIASSTESMAVAWDIVSGVTPGRTGTPQTALQLTAPGGSFVLNIAAGGAHIQGTDDAAQGMYAILQNAATTITLGTHNNATNPRVDAIVVRYNDSYYTNRSPADAFDFEQILGTPTGGANLTNLTGAPATPTSAVLLAYILILNTDTTGVQAGNVLDKRVLSGPAIWGEDNHRYRLGVDSAGNLFLGQVV